VTKPAANDAVLIRDLKVATLIGVHPWERKAPQTLLLDLELGCDARRGAKRDAIADALDYEAVARRLGELGKASSFQLLESFAEAAAAMLQAEFAVTRIVMTVRKQGALREAREVAVRIERKFD
jgi:dihydroneopterin aldolase